MPDMDSCPVCEGAQATTWIFTHLSPPATMYSCEEHTEINVITLLAIRLNVDVTWLYEQIEQAVNGAADQHDAENKRDQAAEDEYINHLEEVPEVAEETQDAQVQH